MRINGKSVVCNYAQQGQILAAPLSLTCEVMNCQVNCRLSLIVSCKSSFTKTHAVLQEKNILPVCLKDLDGVGIDKGKK